MSSTKWIQGVVISLSLLLGACGGGDGDSGRDDAPDLARDTDNVSPKVDSFDATPAAVKMGDAVTFGWSVSDSDNDSLTCKLDVDADGTDDYTISNCANNTSQTHAYVQAGDYQVRLTVFDGVNAAVQRSVPVTVSSSATVIGAGGDSISVLRLAGNDAATFGGEFELTEYAYRKNIGGSTEILSAGTDGTIEFVLITYGEVVNDSYIPPADVILLNIFTDEALVGISMRVDINGQTWNYVTDGCGPNINGLLCESIVFDSANRKIILNNVAVHPSGSGQATGVLTMDGEVKWSVGDEG